MKIPPTHLLPTVLHEVVEEFVTRDGTDHSKVQQRIKDVLAQLDQGTVELHFDSETATCNIIAVENED